MLKAAIEKIEEMAKAKTIEIDGHWYLTVDGTIEEIHPDVFCEKTLGLNSLDAMVKMIQLEKHPGEKIFVKIPTHMRVEAFYSPNRDLRFERVVPFVADATDVPGWQEETKLPFEKAAIALQTRFQDSEDRAYTLQLLSQITTGAKVTYNDIGVATTIVSQKGVSLQTNATIRPLVRLRPYRTFQEIEQPLGLFLIRIDERGISFIEADGGMWKLEARKTIKAYLEERLKVEIESGAVVVML